MGELVEPTDALTGLLQDGRGRRLANNTILSKIFPGGYISMFGANVPGDFRRAKGNFLYADEIDAIAIAESDEGDQLRQFAVRGSEYPDTVQVIAHTHHLKANLTSIANTICPINESGKCIALNAGTRG